MKNKIYTIKGCLLGALLLWASACEVLDLKPVSEISQENFWQTPDDAAAAVTAIYDGLQSGLIWTSVWGEVRADVFSRTQGNVVAALSEVLDNRISPSTTFGTWEPLYNIINRTNLVLINVESIPGLSEGKKNQYLGEAYFARAISYFFAVRVWGDVPLVTEPFLSASDDFEIPRSPKADVFAQIEADLEMAVTLLPTSYTSAVETRGRATKGAAQALQTDVFLWIAQLEGGGAPYFQQAVASADAVLGNSLYGLLSAEQYNTLFFTKNTQESIFELQFDVANGELQDPESSGGTSAPAALTLALPFNNFDRLAISEQFLAAVEPGDLRLEYFTFNLDTEAPRFFKYPGTPNGTNELMFLDANIIFYRVADILLLKAEALNALGQSAEAAVIVNQIRNRAGLANTTATSPEEVKAAILQERYVELAAEGKRWFDLVRNGVALETMDNISDPANLLWPVREDVIEQNSAIEQNSFYQ